MGTTDNWFRANGSVVNYTAAGWGNAGFVARGRPPFSHGGVFSGSFYGVFGGTQIRYGEWPNSNVYSTRAGVRGTSPDATGVAGTSTSSPGVYGQSGKLLTFPSGIRAGVVGTANNVPGVIGWSTVWDAILGYSYSGNGVVGTSSQGRGVYGRSYTLSGVEGVSGNVGPAVPNLGTTAGVFGTSGPNPGLIGTSNGHVGVFGFSNGAIGVVGQTLNPASFAGYFSGNVIVLGNFTVTGGTKSAAVAFPDGSQRVLYCMESPELWFEDFGTAKLKRGRALVDLDADFAKVIKRGDYRVFLTPEGDCHGLYVRRKTAASFEVRELMSGKSSIAFSYRIVGRRKDIRAQRRFAKIDTSLSVPASPPRPLRKPSATASRVRAFVAQVEREARAPKPKRAKKKGRRSRALPKPLRIPLPA